MTRLPLAPLLSVSCSVSSLAERLNVSTRTLHRDRVAGLSFDKAEAYADRLGIHPSALWPEWGDMLIELNARECDDCGSMFVPDRRNGRFCSATCRRRYWARVVARVRRQRPEVAQANREARARYYAANGDYERQRQRRYDAEHRDEIRLRKRAGRDKQVRCLRCDSLYLVPSGPPALARFESERAVEWLNTHRCVS